MRQVFAWKKFFAPSAAVSLIFVPSYNSKAQCEANNNASSFTNMQTDIVKYEASSNNNLSTLNRYAHQDNIHIFDTKAHRTMVNILTVKTFDLSRGRFVGYNLIATRVFQGPQGIANRLS